MLPDNCFFFRKADFLLVCNFSEGLLVGLWLETLILIPGQPNCGLGLG